MPEDEKIHFETGFLVITLLVSVSYKKLHVFENFLVFLLLIVSCMSNSNCRIAEYENIARLAAFPNSARFNLGIYI